jgi:restriction endonuclease
MEQITYNDDSLGCYNGSVAAVYPVTQDEYSKVRRNPFKGSTKYKALRLDVGDNIVELISKYQIGEYLIRYLSKPEPIILENLPEGLTIEGNQNSNECKLNSVLHQIILERAVQMALQAKGIGVDR